MDIRTFGSNAQPSPAISDAGTLPAPAVKTAAPVELTEAVRATTEPRSAEQVKQAVSDINKAMESLSRGVEFSLDEDTHRTVVKVIDQQTKEVLRQMPSEEALAIAKALDKLQGLLIRQQA
jgi:flagellar protein FlaG